jgi:hypothetical protein
MQSYLLDFKPGELIQVKTQEKAGAPASTRIVQLAARPDLPLAEAAKADTKERLVAPLFGMILGSPGGGTIYPTYLVKQVLPGSAADQAGLSQNDPVSIRAFMVDDKQGLAAIQIDTKLLSQGYMERPIQLAAALDTPTLL